MVLGVILTILIVLLAIALLIAIIGYGSQIVNQYKVMRKKAKSPPENHNAEAEQHSTPRETNPSELPKNQN